MARLFCCFAVLLFVGVAAGEEVWRYGDDAKDKRAILDVITNGYQYQALYGDRGDRITEAPTNKNGGFGERGGCNEGCPPEEEMNVECMQECNEDAFAAAANDESPLFSAARDGQDEFIKALLVEGIENVNGASPNGGATPLFIASFEGHVETMEILLEHGAEVGLARADGWAPLHVASENGHTEAAKVLLDRGADVLAGNGMGATPLFIACFNGHTETARLLIENGANVDTRDEFGWSPVYVSAERGFADTVSLLIENNVDVETPHANGGWTPAYIANEMGHQDVVKLLEDAVAAGTHSSSDDAVETYNSSDEASTDEL